MANVTNAERISHMKALRNKPQVQVPGIDLFPKTEIGAVCMHVMPDLGCLLHTQELGFCKHDARCE
jgi:hypothetical protein